MLGVLGWIAVDMGLRLPFTKYAGYNAVQAHDAFVKSGDMTVGLLAIGFLEVVMGAAIYEMSKGSDRAPGQFEFGASAASVACGSTNRSSTGRAFLYLYTFNTNRPPGPWQGPLQVRPLPGVGDQERVRACRLHVKVTSLVVDVAQAQQGLTVLIFSIPLHPPLKLRYYSRLAMLAFGGIATQAVLTNGGFPYMN